MKTPSRPTLRKYGLSVDEWQAIVDRQGGRCPICHRDDAPMVIDHEHVRGWKKMPPEERKLYVRGVICSWCNRWIVGRGTTVTNLLHGHFYLSDYETRKQNDQMENLQRRCR